LEVKVIVYSTPTCSSCDAAKQFLRERGIAYQEINVAKDLKAAERMIKLSGQTGLPVIEIGGEVIVGFDKRRLSEVLGL